MIGEGAEFESPARGLSSEDVKLGSVGRAKRFQCFQAEHLHQ